MPRRAQPWAHGRDLSRCLVLALCASTTLSPRTCDAWHTDSDEIDQSTFWQWFVTIFGGSGASENQGAFSVVSGGCFTSRNASCVHSPGWPDFYIKDERCDIHAEQTGVVEVETFYAAGFRGVDGLRVDGRLYSGTGDGLQGLVLKVGTAISWEASVSLDALDILRMGNQSIAGFSICLADIPTNAVGEENTSDEQPSDEPTSDEQPGDEPTPWMDDGGEPRFRQVSGSCNISYQPQDRSWCFASSVQGPAADVDGCILEVQAVMALRVKSLPRLPARDAVVWANGVGISNRNELHGLVVGTGSTVAWPSTSNANAAAGTDIICDGQPPCISICEGALPPPSPGWTPPPLRWMSGACKVSDSGRCVSSPYWPEGYRHHMHCSIAVDADMVLDIQAFHIEQEFDLLTITGPTGEKMEMSGDLFNNTGDASITGSFMVTRTGSFEVYGDEHEYILPAGSTIQFESDSSVDLPGFHLCAREMPSPPLPSPPLPPLPSQPPLPLLPPPPTSDTSSRAWVETLGFAVGGSLALVLGGMIALYFKRRMRTATTPSDLPSLFNPSNSLRKKRSTSDTIIGLSNVLLTIDKMLAGKMTMGPIRDLEGFERLTTVSDEKSAVSSNVVRPAPSETSSLQSSMGVGDMMGDYQCIAVMTHGVTGACYLVRHLAQGNLYVLKVPRKGSHTQSSVTEAYLAALLNHPNIVHHHQTFIHDGTLVVASEYCMLGDLQTLIDAAIHMKLKFTAEMVMAVLVNLCKGVAWMHHNSVAHRDIKPENVFLDSDGVPKLGDLGSCRFMLDTSTSFVGTPLYMAPEVLTHQPHTTKLDVWSLGLVIYQLCTLKVPFPADSVDALKAKVLQLPPPIPTDEFPAELAQLVSQMMAVDPEQRPSAAELLAVPWVAQLMANQPKLHTVLKTQATSMLLKWKQSHGVTSRIASGSEHSLDAHHSLPV